MCGISGILQLGSQVPPDRRLIERINNQLDHRGPDEAGIHIEPGVALGHRRLSIIDITGGQQPLFNEDHTVAVVFNGEIYNFRELTQQLIEQGHQFRTHSDTEVIVHAWEQWGVHCVDHFRGMFSFALWDRNRKQLMLARDRLGIKPLYYSLLDDGQLIFGSELKALLAHPRLNRQLDPYAVEDYFSYGYVPEPRSILKGVYKLEMGHRLLIDQTRRTLPQPDRYWDLAFTVSEDSNCQRNYQDSQRELISRIQQTLGVHLLSEVPLGAFLSGGIDSSAMVALMSHQLDEPVKTCAIGFDVAGFDESAFAAQVANRYQTDHRLDRLQAEQLHLIDRIPGLFDEPFADSSAIPSYQVCQAARQRVKVVVSGDGGDENFAGYRRYRLHIAEHKIRQYLPLGLRQGLFGLLGKFYPKADWAPRILRAKTTFQALARDSVAAWSHSVSRMPETDRNALYSRAMQQQLGGYHGHQVMYRHASQASIEDPLSLIQYLDFKTFLPAVLHKVDRTSMAHGLEVRVPLLDHQLVEWIARLPPAWKLHKGQGKHIFREALRRHLPADVLDRPKQGFSVPLAVWFRGPLSASLRDDLNSERLLDCGLFERAHIQRLLEQHQSRKRDNSTALWELMMFHRSLKQLGIE